MDLLGGMCGFLWVLLVGDTLLAVNRIQDAGSGHKGFEEAIQITARRWGVWVWMSSISNIAGLVLVIL